MKSTKETLDSLKKQRLLLEYYEQIKLAAYYNLLEEKETDKPLKKVKDTNFTIHYKDNIYSPYINEETKEFVFAYKKMIFDENGSQQKSISTILLPPSDFQEHYQELKKQDAQYDQLESKIYQTYPKNNTTRKYLLLIASLVIILGIIAALNAITYDFLTGLIIILGTLLTTASLFGLAEIIKLLNK